MSIIANRYIEALLSLSKNEEEKATIEKSLKEVSNLFNSNEEFKRVMLDPRINSNSKVEIIKEIFPEYTKKRFINFIKLLIEENRISYIEEIAKTFEDENKKEKGELNIKIIVAKQIDDEQTKSIIEKYKKIYNAKTIKYEIEIDESLIGGVKVVVGNKIYDGSVATQLKQMF